MYYILSKSFEDPKWQPELNPQDGTRLSFVSAREADEAATEIAIGSHKMFVAVDEAGHYVSLIYSGNNPYNFKEDYEQEARIEID